MRVPRRGLVVVSVVVLTAVGCGDASSDDAASTSTMAGSVADAPEAPAADRGRFGPVDTDGVDGAATVDASVGDVVGVAVGVDGVVWGAGSAGLMRFDATLDQVVLERVADGLPSDRVTSVAVDGDGIVWAGTDAGLAVRDGDRWRAVDDALAPGTARVVLTDPAGGVWSLSEQGPARLVGAEWVVAPPLGGEAGGQPWFSLGEQGSDVAGVDGEGALWSMANAERPLLTRWDGEGWDVWTMDDTERAGASVFAVEPADRGVWLVTGERIVRFDGEVWSSWAAPPTTTGGTPRAATLDGAGRLWIGLQGGGLAVFDGGTVTAWPSVDGQPTDGRMSVFSLARGADPYLWMGTGSGRLVRLDPEAPRIDLVSPDRQGVPVDQRSRIAVAPDGALWTWDGDGVWRFDGIRWTDHRDPDVTASYDDLAFSPGGVAWLATDRGVGRFDGATWRWFGDADGVSGDRVTAIAVDATGVVYATTAEDVAWGDIDLLITRQLLVLDGGGTWTAAFTSALDPDRIDAFDEDWDEHADEWLPSGARDIVPAGDEIWVSGGWTCRLTGDRCLVVDPPTEDRPGPLVNGPDGTFWTVDDRGVHHYVDGAWATVATRDDMSVSSPVLSLAVGPGDEIYLGLQEDGISYFDGTAWRSLTAADGLADRYLVDEIVVSPTGGVWAIGHSGLMRIFPVDEHGVPAPGS